MKTVTVADLRNKFATISKWIAEGEAVTVTKRGVPFATLSPARKDGGNRDKLIPGIDWQARLNQRFPKGPVPGDSQKVLDYDRGNS